MNASELMICIFARREAGSLLAGESPCCRLTSSRSLRKSAPEEWTITVETSLFVPRNYLAQVIDAVDLFVVDCKDMNEDIYRKYTGEDLFVMEENLQFLLQRKDAESILVRVPLIPDYNTVEDQNKSAEKLREMGVERLDLFEYRVKK